MICFFRVASFDIRNIPDISWVLSEGIAAPLSFVWTLIVSLSWIPLWNSHGIQIKGVVVPFSEPEYCFVPATESFGGVRSVIEGPYNPISQN